MFSPKRGLGGELAPTRREAMERMKDVARRKVGKVVKRTVRGVLDLLPLHNKLQPISKNFGIDRGVPIDRYYIEKFLSAHRDRRSVHASTM
jgi:hypothetical protein